MKENKSVKNLTTAAVIAAMYIAITLASMLFGISGNAPIQFRPAEALTILPIFTPAAIPGLTVGCLISNMIMGCVIYDVIFGSLATLIGAVLTYYIGKKRPYLAIAMPIIANTVIIPLILRFAYGAEGSMPYFFATIFASEVLSAGVLGVILYRKLRNVINKIL